MKKPGKTKLLLIVILQILLVFMISCQKTSEQPGEEKKGEPSKVTETGKLRVVTTILPLYHLAKNVGGDKVEVHNLLPTGASPHSYAPSVDDSMSVEKAGVILVLGLQLDDWIKKIAQSSGNNSPNRIVIVSNGIETLKTSEDGEHKHGKEEGHSQHHHHGDIDPHLWMDPVRMKNMAKNVYTAFSKAKPGEKEYFEKNYNDYILKLDELDKKYSDELSKFKKKDFVTFHTILNYTAHRYGMNQVAVIASSPGKQPDPRHIAEIVDILKKNNVKIVFAEPQFSPKASKLIAREIKGKIAVIDPLGSLEDPKRDTYIKNMEENLKALVEAFKEEN